MNAEFLIKRNSYPKLTEPAPQGDCRKRIFQAALRAPDHGMLKPWRYLVIEGERRAKLGEVMESVLRQTKPDATEAEYEKCHSNPYRAPLIIVPVCRLVENPKVPEIEQILSTGCSVHQMLLAAEAEGFGGIWRTGSLTYTSEMHRALNLEKNERLLGFLYLGTPDGNAKIIKLPEVSAYFEAW